MSLQQTHNTTPFLSKKFPVILVCDGVQSPSNIGSLFRICEAMGVLEVVFCNSKINFDSPRLKKTARSTQKKVSYSESSDILKTLEELQQKGFSPIALEITDNSVHVEKLSLAKNEKITLIIGNEKLGVSEIVLEYISQSIHIDMFGDNSSMNVVQATSIALYSIINKLYLY